MNSGKKAKGALRDAFTRLQPHWSNRNSTKHKRLIFSALSGTLVALVILASIFTPTIIQSVHDAQVAAANQALMDQTITRYHSTFNAALRDADARVEKLPGITPEQVAIEKQANVTALQIEPEDFEVYQYVQRTISAQQTPTVYAPTKVKIPPILMLAPAAVVEMAPQPTPLPSTAMSQQRLKLDDPLQNNDGEQNWDTGPNTHDGSDCEFPGDAYHITMDNTQPFPLSTDNIRYSPVVHHPTVPSSMSPTEYGDEGICLARSPFTASFSNFIYQADMTVDQGDGGGLVFRASVCPTPDDFCSTMHLDDGEEYALYYFYISSDGTYALYTNDHTPALVDGESPSIYTDLGQSNTLTVIAEGSILELFVNYHLVEVVNDSQCPVMKYPECRSGLIGLAAGSIDATDSADVVFTNAKVWKL